MGLARFVRYLVTSKLSGSKSYDALKLFAEGYSYREIASITGMKFSQVRGYISYAINQYGNSAKARAMIKYIIPIVEKIEPIVRDGQCLICNTRVDWGHPYPARIHVSSKHGDLVDAYEKWVLSELYRAVNT